MENCSIYDLGMFSVCGGIDTGQTYPTTGGFILVVDGPHGRNLTEVSATMGEAIIFPTGLNEYSIYYLRILDSNGDEITLTISGDDYQMLKIETIP